jgi:antitoxin (DNA-binding transcriptional repressor) of toxin-antitoxin stability system
MLRFKKVLILFFKKAKLDLANWRFAMAMINIHKAKTNLSKLIDAASHGENIIIAKAGKPVARIVRFVSPKPKRKPGALKNKIKIAEDFDAPLPDDILDEFEGK